MSNLLTISIPLVYKDLQGITEKTVKDYARVQRAHSEAAAAERRTAIAASRKNELDDDSKFALYH